MKAKIWHESFWINETNPKKLKNKFNKILLKSGFKILKVLEHFFEPVGYTNIFLLAESHLAIHTFPEFSKTYVELSSCNIEYFCRFLELTKDL